GDHVVDRSLAELVLKGRLHGLLELSDRRGLVPARTLIVGSQILDAPFDERVHQDVLLLRCDEAIRFRRIESQYPVVEVLHVLDQGPFEMQAGLVDDLLELAELEHDRALALIDRERDQAEQDRETDDARDQGDADAVVHGRSPRSRPRSASRERAPESLGAGSLALGAAAALWLSGSVPAADIWTILSRGRYRRLLPAFASISTFEVLARICWIMSRYIRSRVTCGALLYSTRICRKREASPSAFAVTRLR